MVNALDTGLSGASKSPGGDIALCFWARNLISHSASLHPGVFLGTSEVLGVTL